MATFLYHLAVIGFYTGGWPFWNSVWWPYYLAKGLASMMNEAQP